MRDTSTDVMKTFLFTDIVGSTELASAVGSDHHWVNLLRRHDDALRAIFADFHGQVVDHTGDGFFAAFEEADDAVGAAVAIQRAVDQEFEFDIRIGVHSDGALQTRDNYHGKGVHAAARIGAAAAGREILASHATVGELPQFTVTSPRPLDPEGLQGARGRVLGGVGRRLRALAATALVVALLPAACGGDDRSRPLSRR